MKNDKKSTETKKREFKATTLSASELRQVAGGIFGEEMLECTAGTQNICHVDGTVD